MSADFRARRWGAALLASLIVAGVATAGWYSLQQHELQHTAQIIERESYATRSHIARNINKQFEALRSAARFWSVYGHLNSDQWDQDAKIEISHFHGFEWILWDDPSRDVRYATSLEEDFAWNYRPDAGEWQKLQPLLQDIDRDAGEQVIGPEERDGGFRYRVQIPAYGPDESGMLVALVDPGAQLEQLLTDQSPGYVVKVIWDDAAIYERGESTTELPENWTAEGVIELSVGPKWRVVHQPSAELADEMSRPTLPGLLVAGWLIAALLGAVLYKSSRAREREEAARLAQREYAELNSELEDRVNERTADLEIITQSLSHDVRNSLHAIGMTGLVLSEAEPIPDPGELGASIQRSVGECLHLLERLQTYSSQSLAIMERQLVDMKALAQKVWTEMDRPWAGEFRIEDLPPCLAQSSQIEILLHNLLSNAVKFTAEVDDPTITVGADSADSPTVYWVRDNGRGFDASAHGDVFRPFVQASESGSQGRGLGLAISERIVRRHGGRIWAESRQGFGATFKFELGPESIPGSQHANHDQSDGDSAGNHDGAR